MYHVEIGCIASVLEEHASFTFRVKRHKVRRQLHYTGTWSPRSILRRWCYLQLQGCAGT